MPTGFIVQPTYRVRSGRAVVQLFGRLSSGEAFLVEDDRFRPYFFIGEHDAIALAGAGDCEIAQSPLTDFAGRPVLRVTAALPSDVPVLREKVERAGGRALEADVRFPYRYLIDRGIRGGLSIEGTPRESETGLLRFRNPDLAPAACRPELTILSVDLETTPDAGAIYSIALVGGDVDEVHLVSDRAVDGAIRHRNEAQLLAAACARVRAIDPDIVTGWNVVDFDLRVWEQRCRALGVPCELGRVDGPVRFDRDQRFTRQSRADIPGRMVLDGIPLVRDAVRLEDYRLETAARSILGRGKLIDHEVPDRAAEITRLYREEPAALVAYNREDSRLVLDILEHEGLLDLTIERSSLCGMQLDRVGASIASFDLVYLPELRGHGVVAPSVDRAREPARVRGGALLEPQPGLHAGVAVYDFKSLYPSLIRTFNLEPLAHVRAGPDSLHAPGGARFARGDAILPAVIERYMQRRDEAKTRGDRHADQAIKIMMNALFGVLGAASCRFFDPAIANAITGFGQQTLAWTRDAFEDCGMQVLYGDTDSVFVKLAVGSGVVPDGLAEELRDRVRATRLAGGDAPPPDGDVDAAVQGRGDRAVRGRSRRAHERRRARRRTRVHQADPQGVGRPLHRQHASPHPGGAQGRRTVRSDHPLPHHEIRARAGAPGAAAPGSDRPPPLHRKGHPTCRRRDLPGDRPVLRRRPRPAAPALPALV
ncbi:MAG: DNA polymerase domain-containing protein [Myxococcota bacterium]